MEKYTIAKIDFLNALKSFSSSISEQIAKGGEWDIRGFIDIFKNVYPMSADTKIVSKVLELHLFPFFLRFAQQIGYTLELAKHQNYYPDLTFISVENPDIKFAVDLKTTYRLPDAPDFCNGFTLGSHGVYFLERNSTKNIQYPYSAYSGHFCFGIIYSRINTHEIDETKRYTIEEIDQIPAILNDFLFFAEEKWKIASDKRGSGNTANIGSIQKISDILSGNGVFAKAGEEHFDDYWCNYERMTVKDLRTGMPKPLTSFAEYLEFRGLDSQLNNPKASVRKGGNSHER